MRVRVHGLVGSPSRIFVVEFVCEFMGNLMGQFVVEFMGKGL